VPSPRTAPAELLAALARVLSELRVPWYVFGAQAAIVWGRPRLTADVDVTVRLDTETPERLVQAMEESGFRLRVGGEADDFVRRTPVLPFVHTTTELPVDVVLAGPGLEELFLSRAIGVTMGNVVVPVISPEDLIVTKILAGRPKDIEDVRGVLRERATELDLDSIRTTLGMLEDALGQSDLRPLFEQELSRVGKTRP
jgi:hypothetical protein